MTKFLKIIIIVIMFFTTGCGGKINQIVKTNINEVEQDGYNLVARIDENTPDDNQNNNLDNGEVTDKSTNRNDKSTVSKNSNNNVNSSNTGSGQQTSTTDNTNDLDNQMINVSISIDCKNILANKSDLEDGYHDYVPDSGMILSTKTYKVKKGTTVVEVLQSATSENKINLVTQASAFGLYVKSIGYLEEKICGSSSGWLYKVNGKIANKAASSYKLNEGDKIEWRYTCKQGDV